MNVFGMGWQEMMIILVGALIIFGPDRLPELAGQLARGLRDIRKMTGDLTGELERHAGVNDIKKAVQSELHGIQGQVNSVQKTLNTATGSVNSSIATATANAKGTTSAKTTGATTTAAKGTTTTAAKTNGVAAAKVVPAKATKKDPLADIGFFDEVQPVAAPKTAVAAVATSNGSTTSESLDAVSRARQRRAAAGYNRKVS